MSNGIAKKLRDATGLCVYESSVCEAGGAVYFLARRGTEKLVGMLGPGCRQGAEQVAELDGKCVCAGPLDHANAEAIRERLPWTAPKCVGLATSVGLGDRLGLATPGHIRAMRARGRGLVPFLAQQSIREMDRTERTAEQVMDAATFGVLQEGFRDGFGSDADHLQKREDIDVTVAAGFTMFTIDPGAHVVDEADALSGGQLAGKYGQLDFESLAAAPVDLEKRYIGKCFLLDGGGQVRFDEQSFQRAAVKYGGAIAHTVRMYRHLRDIATAEFELEVSVDETESPTSPAEHYFFAAELKRLGVEWVSMAPRFVGRMEKGVDYIGDLDEFRARFADHAAVMRTVGPYKMSIHSGSDKFSIYPLVAELTDGMAHLKTAGTSYLEAIRALAKIDPALFREIYEFARANYETDKATYHVSADITKVPPAAALGDDELAARIDDFDTRQALHVTFGSVLTALTADGKSRFRTRIYDALEQDEEAHYGALEKHLGRHVAPFAKE